MAIETERTLAKPKELNEYLKNLPIDLELRFPSTTSLKGDFAVIMVIYNPITKCVLLGAYNTKLSGLPKDDVEVETNGPAIDTEETPFTLLRFAITKETGLDAKAVKWLGFPKKVKNTNLAINAEFHERNYALIDKFKGNVKMPDKMLNPKIEEFVWVKDFLLNMIFDRTWYVLNVPMKPHPQKEAYKRFVDNRRSKAVSFEAFLKGRIHRRRPR